MRAVRVTAIFAAVVLLSLSLTGSRADARRPAGIILTGDQVVPGPGDPTGYATAKISSSKGQFCFEVDLRDISGLITSIEIHEAAAGQVGPLVLTLSPMPPGVQGLRGCVPIDRALLRQISRDKAGYSIEIRTTTYPNGAIRAQLGS
jgi:hypothetical protein